jgi:HlyD family secretion protein
MKFLNRKWLVIVVVTLAIGLAAALGMSRAPKQQYFTSRVQRGTISDMVQATGTINAVKTVQVGSQVSGTISKLNADFNSHVKQGEVIAEIEPSLFRGAVLQARADLQDASANLAAARANLLKAQATATQTKSDFERTGALAKEGVMSQQQLDLARANADTNQAAVSAAQAQVTQAAAQIQQKQAALAVAQTNLDHTIIRSPIDGVVVARTVDVGQTVAASLQAPNLFNIAQDLTKMQVDTQTDESDVGNIKVGQQATFKVDAYPDQTFTGRVVQVRLNPTTVQNVVTYDTVIAFDNPQTKLFPGMTAYVSLPVATANNVLEVSNSALRFKPDLNAQQLRAAYEKAGINVAQLAPETDQTAKTAAVAGAKTKAAPASHADVGVVWKQAKDGSLQPVQLRTGITDHTNTEIAQVLKGDLQSGDQLVIGSLTPSQKSSSAPGMGGVPRGR